MFCDPDSINLLNAYEIFILFSARKQDVKA